MKANCGLTVERMLELGRVSWSGFHLFEQREPGPDLDMDVDLRDAVRRIAVEWPSYGRTLRITAELRRRGWYVNPKTRLPTGCREDNLLCMRKRKFIVTTDSNHPRNV